MPSNARHASHPDIVIRLRRAEGHLRNVIEMIEAQRGCLEIAQQMHAVEKAIAAAKKTLIHDHIEHCLEQAVGPVLARLEARSTSSRRSRNTCEFHASAPHLARLRQCVSRHA
jgi:DNA-binding FrmR family transcriptional regulator